MLWRPALRPGPHWGSLQYSPGPLDEISNILFEIISEMLRESNSDLVTPINIIFNCIKELLLRVIAFCTACFFRAKINKNIWPPYFECSGAGTVTSLMAKMQARGSVAL